MRRGLQLAGTVTVAACAAVMSGCYGGSTSIVAPNASVPVSLSRAVRGPDGHVVRLDEREVVGEFAYDTTAWSMAYGLAQLDDVTDISDEINRQVRTAGGQAVTNLRAYSIACGWGWVWPLNWLPFWPGCSSIEIRGDIIRLRPGVAARATRPVETAAKPAEQAAGLPPAEARTGADDSATAGGNQ